MRASAIALALLLWPGLVFGSAGSAWREYKHGQYEQALKEYEQLLQRQGDDARLHFNAGAAAYRSQQLEAAAKQFDEALNASDLRLQEMAYYNRGNALYYLGERNPDPAKRGEAWQKSVQDFQSSLKLNPQDQDAKYNLEFVKKKLEELKQQQQQSRQNKSDQQQNQDQQQPPQQQQPDQAEQQQQSQPQKQDDQKQPQQQAGQSQEQEPQAKPSSAQPKASDQKEESRPAGTTPAGQMTPQQAQQLLDSQKGEELMLPANPKGKPADRRRPIRDW
ncbi:MAG: hypothetical protein ABSF95_06155 [Verrucomicrobiota bacterium]